MINLISTIMRINKRTMLAVYIMEALLEAIYICFMWNGIYRNAEIPLFKWGYSFVSGACMMLDLLLIYCSLKKKDNLRMPLLFTFIVIQLGVFISDILHAVTVIDFWRYDYVWIILEGILMAIYLQRYLELREYKLFCIREKKQL